MVSKASEDLPDPLTPVKMTSLPCGSVTSTFLRLCVRAPRTMSGPRAGCLASGILMGTAGGVHNPPYCREFHRNCKRGIVLPRFSGRKRTGISPGGGDEYAQKADGCQRSAEIEQLDG